MDGAHQGHRFEPHRRIVHIERMFLPDPTPDSHVETTFAPDGTGTLLTMIMTLPDAATREIMLATGMEDGMETSYARLENRDGAYNYCRQSLALSRRTGNRSLQANSLFWFGGVCELLGETEQARDYFQQSLALWREMGRRSQEAAVESRIEKLRQKL